MRLRVFFSVGRGSSEIGVAELAARSRLLGLIRATSSSPAHGSACGSMSVVVLLWMRTAVQRIAG